MSDYGYVDEQIDDNIRMLWGLPRNTEIYSPFGRHDGFERINDNDLGIIRGDDQLYQEYWSDPFWDNSAQGRE